MKDPKFLRANVRYKPEISEVRKIITNSLSGERLELLSLLLDESYSGFACVYTGSVSIEPDTTVIWEETVDVKTECVSVRCKEIHPDVFFLAVKFVN